MVRQEIVFLAAILVTAVAAWALGQWHSRLYATRILGRRVAELERDLEQLSVEVARIDATAILWQPPPDLPTEVQP